MSLLTLAAQFFASPFSENWKQFIPENMSMASLSVEPPTGIGTVEEALGFFWMRKGGHMRLERRNYRILHNAFLIAGAMGFRCIGWLQIAGSIALYAIAHFDKDYKPKGSGRTADKRAHQNTVLLGELILGVIVVTGYGPKLLPGFVVLTGYKHFASHLLHPSSS